MLAVLPLSPLRAQAKRCSGTRRVGPLACQAAGSGSGAAGGVAGLGVQGTAWVWPSMATVTGTCALSMKNASGPISGDGLGRPSPGPVVPGAHEVPAGAISRANSSSARLSGWSATTRNSTSRASRARLCGPYSDSSPSTCTAV